MSFFARLFNRKAVPRVAGTLSTGTSQPPANANEQKVENQIRVLDQFGREVLISKEDWRTTVLPGNIKSHWNDPDQLCALINSALNDGFHADVLSAAEHLCKIDSDPARGASLYSFVLIKNERIDQADRLLRTYLKKNGENAYVLTHLAKVHAARKHNEEVERTLWRSLELDPNQENALLWFAALQKEKNGSAAELDAFKHVAAFPKSWRSQLWLARAALHDRSLDQAIAFYHESLSRAPKPLPAQLLMQISGDLGNQGHLPELLNLVQPHFDPKLHGLAVGNNILKALVDLGQLDTAKRQNYECIFESENMALLTHDLISAAEDPSVGLICNHQWSPVALRFLGNAGVPPNSPLAPSDGERDRERGSFNLLPAPDSPLPRNLFVGVDVGRSQDLTVISVIEKVGDMFFVRAILRLSNLRLPQQQELLEVVCRSPRFAGAQIDMTGLGLGLYEYPRQIRQLRCFASTLNSQLRTLNFCTGSGGAGPASPADLRIQANSAPHRFASPRRPP